VIAPLFKGKLCARPAVSDVDFAAAAALQHQCFGAGAVSEGDGFNALSTQILVEDTKAGRVLCCYRLQVLEGGELRRSYAAQYYGLAKLEAFEGRMLELGRFCIAPACRDPDVLRLAWAVMTEVVDRLDVQMLFGCSSFAGVESDIYHDSFALLRARHLAPACWSPGIMAPEVFEFAKELQRAPNVAKAWREMPPLLRTYLMMGGWVSDHAVVDRQMNTLHVFTGVEVAVIPEQRKRLLRALV